MGYFDKVDANLFTIFGGENKNLYYDIINMIERKGGNDGLYKNVAKKFTISLIEENEEYNKSATGVSLSTKEIEDKATIALMQLENHKWLIKKPEMLGNDRLFISRAGTILMKAMKTIEKSETDFEFKNAVQKVSSLCRSYMENEFSNLDLYIGFLQEVYDQTQELEKNMARFHRDFEEMIKDLSTSMSSDKLVEYITDILDGKRMKNYTRILNDESGYYRYKSYIIEVIKQIKFSNLDAFISSYKNYVDPKDQDEDPESYIWQLLTYIQEFYENKYSDLVAEMTNTISVYLKRVNNKVKMAFADVLGQDDISDMLIRVVGKNIDMNAGKYLSINVNNIFNLWRPRFINIDSISHNKDRSNTTTEISKPDIVDAEFEEKSLEYMLKSLDELNKTTAEVIKKDLEERFNGKDSLHVSEFPMTTVDDYIYLHKIIELSTHDDFPYKVRVLDDEENVSIGNMECTPFKLIRK